MKRAKIAPEVCQWGGRRSHWGVACGLETYAPRILSRSNEARRESQ